MDSEAMDCQLQTTLNLRIINMSLALVSNLENNPLSTRSYTSYLNQMNSKHHLEVELSTK
jgi:hypothetical protein